MKKIAIEVNGKKVSKEIQDHTTLSGLLRDILNLQELILDVIPAMRSMCRSC